MNNITPKNDAVFTVSAFGKIKEYSPTLSSIRVRIFYKGANRNSTYITEEFANKLLSTISYAPVKGIYDEDDFLDHGEKRSEGRIYGVVPEEPNLTWENHLDDDGVTRTYACVDVLLFTALYPEAKEIPTKGQSMEIYTKSIKGDWKMIDGKRFYVYEDGCFLGLQALGDEHEPCFEGAEFFSLYTKLKNLVDTRKGGKEMLNFKLSDSTKHDMLFDLLNPNCTQENNWEISYGISDIYDSYALCFDYEKQEFCRWFYQKDDATNEVTLGSREKCYILDINEKELQALNFLKMANGETFEEVDKVYTAANDTIETLKNDFEFKGFEVEIVNSELEVANSTLIEKDTAIETLKAEQKTAMDLLVAEKEIITGELSSLKDFKNKIETTEKDEIISRYALILSEEEIKPFVEGKANFDIVTLKKELAYLAIEKNPNVFIQRDAADDAGFIPTPSTENLSEATKLLMKHKKNR